MTMHMKIAGLIGTAAGVATFNALVYFAAIGYHQAGFTLSVSPEWVVISVLFVGVCQKEWKLMGFEKPKTSSCESQEKP